MIEGGMAVPAPIHVIRTAFAETPLGPMAAIIPNFGENGANDPEYMSPVSLMVAFSSIQSDKLTGDRAKFKYEHNISSLTCNIY